MLRRCGEEAGNELRLENAWLPESRTNGLHIDISVLEGAV
jgi:hypothetical protein